VESEATAFWSNSFLILAIRSPVSARHDVWSQILRWADHAAELANLLKIALASSPLVIAKRGAKRERFEAPNDPQQLTQKQVQARAAL
jgi:hypothetical protein